MSHFSTEFSLLPVKMLLLCNQIAAVIEDGAEKALLERVLVFFAKHIIAKCSALASLSQSDLESAIALSTDESCGLSSQVIQDMAQHFSIAGNEISAQAIMAGTAPQGVKLGERELGAARAAVPPRQPCFYVDFTISKTKSVVDFFWRAKPVWRSRFGSLKHSERFGTGIASSDCCSAVLPLD